MDIPGVHNVTSEEEGPYICWDCKGPTLSYDQVFVITRQTSGPTGNSQDRRAYASDFEDVIVHADRRDCAKFKSGSAR